jgi:hypothetical protein
MRNVTLGGERLGSGNKMKVGLHGFERSTHDLGYVWRSTMSCGTLVPFMNEIGLPGDTFDIDLNCDVMTAPTVGPLFGSFKVQLDVFQVPIRLYNSLLHNNMLGIGNDMKQVKLPTITLTQNANGSLSNRDINNSSVNPSCLLNYLGIRGVGRANTNNVTRAFNGTSILAYWDIYKNYYSSKQEKVGAYLSGGNVGYNPTVTSVQVANPTVTIVQAPNNSVVDDLTTGSVIMVNYSGAKPDPKTILFNLNGRSPMNLEELCLGIIDTGTKLEGVYNFGLHGLTYIINWQYAGSNTLLQTRPDVAFFNLSNIDDMRKAILAFSSTSNPFSINGQNYAPYNELFGSTSGGFFRYQFSQGGLGIKTYQSDLLNNWLDTTWISNINTSSAVAIVGGSFTIDQLNFSKKVYEMLNRIAVSGGSYNDWLDSVYDHERNRIPESPMYMGGLIKELVFQEVVSTAATDSEALGTLGGRGKLSGKHKGGKVVIKVDEPCYIMGIVSLTPRIDYSQGNRWDTGLQTVDDLHKPNLDEIGFQDLITEQMAFWDTSWNGTAWVKRSAGKQPAWLNYMTNYNRTYGNFAIDGNQMFMTLNRKYEYNSATGVINDLTSYIDPKKFNNLFPSTTIDSQNFWCQIGVDITARRKMSAKIMPNL